MSGTETIFVPQKTPTLFSLRTQIIAVRYTQINFVFSGI